MSGHQLALSSSRTPREQLLMAHTMGRAKLDAEVIASNGRLTGRRCVRHDKEQENGSKQARPRGKAHVDPTASRAAAAHHGSGALDSDRSARIKQRRHFQTTSQDLLADPPANTSPPRGKAHTRRDTGTSPVYPAVRDGVENRTYVKAELDQQKEEFAKHASPKRHGFTFQPAPRIDRRNEEARLLPNGIKRAEKKAFHKQQSVAEAVTPPWI